MFEMESKGGKYQGLDRAKRSAVLKTAGADFFQVVFHPSQARLVRISHILCKSGHLLGCRRRAIGASRIEVTNHRTNQLKPYKSNCLQLAKQMAAWCYEAILLVIRTIFYITNNVFTL